MLDLVDGLPLHPLVVHAVVVLLPLAVLGTLAVVAVPRLRPFTLLVALVATTAAVLLPVASESGEALEERVGEPGVHAELGEQLVVIGIALAVVLWLLTLLRRGGPGPLTAVVAALAVVTALLVGVQVYRVGESGARATWGDVAGTTQPAEIEDEDD
ncbi:DUF2231 domain-containing protein [Georgenia muralis]|uniref:Putative membrane protein n=1 Tax=Georgenia muralis TaxID=154117 RepID=A0A3N4ZMT4_9MICO|nr:DUF2231 domain-containing protein [Georgenia muralis]RPF27002.1 putative membrane protein [Georgenia muralis]